MHHGFLVILCDLSVFLCLGSVWVLLMKEEWTDFGGFWCLLEKENFPSRSEKLISAKLLSEIDQICHSPLRNDSINGTLQAQDFIPGSFGPFLLVHVIICSPFFKELCKSISTWLQGFVTTRTIFVYKQKKDRMTRDDKKRLQKGLQCSFLLLPDERFVLLH